MALAINPNYIGTLYHKGIALDNLGRFDEAVGVYDRILSLDPGYETNIHYTPGQSFWSF